MFIKQGKRKLVLIVKRWFTNRPPKGDRSEGFSFMFIEFVYMFLDFCFFSFETHFLYTKIEPGWWGMSPGCILEYVCLWERPQRLHSESPNLNFHFFRPHFWKRPFLLFVPNPLFESRIFKSILYKTFLWSVRTILVFTEISSLYGNTLPKKRILGKIDFWDFCNKD